MIDQRLLALDRLDLSDDFRADGHCRCPGSVSLWGREKPGYNDFILNPIGPAWHIDRPRFEAMLRTRARETGASIWTTTRAIGVEDTDNGFVVLLQHRSEGKRQVRAAWVLDATGCAAWFARRQGATRRTHDRMVAIVRLATISSGTFTSQTVVEAAADGWWYCARLPDARIVTVLVTDQHEARAFMLAGHHRWRDPIASQGIFKALADAADAIDTIAAAAGRRAPPPWSYTERVAARFEDYLANRAHFYRLERRWADAPFWRQRAMV